MGFNNCIILAMIWISFILTAGTSENEKNEKRGNEVEVDIIYHRLAIHDVSI